VTSSSRRLSTIVNRQVGKPRSTFAQIARHTGLIIRPTPVFFDKTDLNGGFPNGWDGPTMARVKDMDGSKTQIKPAA